MEGHTSTRIFPVELIQGTNTRYTNCPHCGGGIEIEQLNCRIFRHGHYIRDGTQIPPHHPKDLCDDLVAKGLIHGCGKPFEIIEINGQMNSVPCDYK